MTRHQGLQVVSAQVVRRSLVDLLRHSLQQAHWNIPEREIRAEHREMTPQLSVSLLLKDCNTTTMFMWSLFLYQVPSGDECGLFKLEEIQYTEERVAADLHMKESHSSMKVRVFSTPRVSEPQCSRPKLVKSLRTSSRSLDEMSQCLLSFISVKIQGLMRAPLRRAKHKKSQTCSTDLTLNSPSKFRFTAYIIRLLNVESFLCLGFYFLL